MSLPLNQVLCGDSAEVMAEWPENSVDCIVTDPPYGIGFMLGTISWDKALPPREAFMQMFRVLKPGASPSLCRARGRMCCGVCWRCLRA